MTSGLIVAGGYSTRFGVVEKPLVEVGGEPMVRRAARALAPLIDDLVVSCRAEQVAPLRRALDPSVLEPRFTLDPEPDCGPVTGLSTGVTAVCEHRGPSDVLVLSCDRPGVRTEVLRALRSHRVGVDAAAAVPTVGGQIQPLCGSYRTRALQDACRAVREDSSRQLMRVPYRLCHLAVPASELCGEDGDGQLRSVDTPLEAAVQPVAQFDVEEPLRRIGDDPAQVDRRVSRRPRHRA